MVKRKLLRGKRVKLNDERYYDYSDEYDNRTYVCVASIKLEVIIFNIFRECHHIATLSNG